MEGCRLRWTLKTKILSSRESFFWYPLQLDEAGESPFYILCVRRGRQWSCEPLTCFNICIMRTSDRTARANQTITSQGHVRRSDVWMDRDRISVPPDRLQHPISVTHTDSGAARSLVADVAERDIVENTCSRWWRQAPRINRQASGEL